MKKQKQVLDRATTGKASPEVALSHRGIAGLSDREIGMVLRCLMDAINQRENGLREMSGWERGFLRRYHEYTKVLRIIRSKISAARKVKNT